MNFIKFWLSQLDILWYIAMIVFAPFAFAWLLYICPIMVGGWMLTMILWCFGKSMLAWRIWLNGNRHDNDMAAIAITNTSKTLLLTIVCIMSMTWAVWATIRLGDAAGDKLCDHPERMAWFTMPRIVLHFYTPTCGPPTPSWLDKDPSDVIFGEYPKHN
jgi:hypothetical protein